MGNSPGYDPLEFTIREARQRGIEVHAWFNPFRALANATTSAVPNHITRSAPELTKRYQNFVWCDPAMPASRQRALAAILDVMKRYDVDGIHLDDYFYPYPIKGERFSDGLSNEARRKIIDAFMLDLYTQVKRAKPWARVGISPFGIWKPGVPTGTTAGLDAYEDLACDARKWLQNGWCDYMAPQLYWRIDGPQCYNLLLEWWRQQGTRPVWPGIATSRIGSPEDPKRRATEIDKQLQLSRSIGRNYAGHMHWSVKSLMENRDNVNELLKARYTSPALVPPMPWLSREVPPTPQFSASATGGKVTVRWQIKDPTTHKLVVQARTGQQWQTVRIAPANSGGIVLGSVDAVAVTAVNRFGNTSAPMILRR
jgi:uncharacterized lipoprotein YddW (UPF0748 family)